MSMVNNNMNDKSQSATSTQSAVTTQPTRPNENGAIHVEGFVKIFDPNTQEVIVEKRA
jgi:hypothetical protein